MLGFGDAERRIVNLFNIGSEVTYNGRNLTIQRAGKPTCSKGEPKTDIYVATKDHEGEIEEFKISYKKENADFLENKTNAVRAEQLFGDSWEEIIERSTSEIREQLENRMLIYKEGLRRTKKALLHLDGNLNY